MIYVTLICDYRHYLTSKVIITFDYHSYVLLKISTNVKRYMNEKPNTNYLEHLRVISEYVTMNEDFNIFQDAYISCWGRICWNIC